MAQVAKVVTIIGSSPESFAKAADAAVQEAGKTLRGITGADVISMSAVVENDNISVYRINSVGSFDLGRWSGKGGISYTVSADAGLLSSTQAGGSIY